MLKNLYFEKSMFRKTAEELRELDKENNIKLLVLLEYLRRKNHKKIRGKNGISKELDQKRNRISK